MDATALFTPFLATAELSIRFNQSTKISVNVWKPNEDVLTDHVIEFHWNPLNLAKTVKSMGHVTKLTIEGRVEYVIELNNEDMIMMRETMHASAKRSENWEQRTIRTDPKGPLTWIWNYEGAAVDPVQFAEDHAGSDSSPPHNTSILSPPV